MAHTLNIRAPNLSQVEQWIGNGAAVLAHRILANELHPSDEDVRLGHALQLFFEAYQQLGNQHSNLYAGVDTLLKSLQHRMTRLGVVTNKPSRFTEPLLLQFGILHYFDLVYSGDSFTEKKNHPRPLLEAAQRMGFDVKECLMSGDSSNDINAAKACGMPYAGVRGGYNHGQDVAECGPD